MYFAVYFGRSCKPFQDIIDMHRKKYNYNNNNNDNDGDDDNTTTTNNYYYSQSTLYAIFKKIFFILCENK